MKNFAVFLGLLTFILTLSFVAVAEEQARKLPPARKKISPYSIVNLPPAPTNLVPLVEPKDLEGNPRGAIPSEVITKIHDRCLSKVPERFTPDAHHAYCTCAAAATQGTIRLGELAELQKDTNRRIENKVFEKYVQEVVSPCMEMPVEEIEYLYCVLYKSNDFRISFIPSYCKCVGSQMREYVKKSGTSNMMIELGNTRRIKNDPVEALWKSNDYQNALEKRRDSCAINYLKQDTPFKQ